MSAKDGVLVLEKYLVVGYLLDAVRLQNVRVFILVAPSELGSDSVRNVGVRIDVRFAGSYLRDHAYLVAFCVDYVFALVVLCQVYFCHRVLRVPFRVVSYLVATVP